MKKSVFATAMASIALLGCLIAGPAWADEPQPKQRVTQSLDVLLQLVSIPENAIPPALLSSANGIAIIPDVLKFGFIFGGRHGSGIVSVRNPDGTWSKPVFVSLTSGSIGFQAGASSTDLILIFKTRRSVQKLADGQFQFGADASVAAGPVGRHVGAATNLWMDAEIYSYSRSRGLFAGVSVQGGRLSIDQKANWMFYNQVSLSAREILNRGGSLDMPKIGDKLVYTLNRYLPPKQSSGRQNSATPNNAKSDRDARTGGQDTSVGSAQARDRADGGITVQRQGQ